MKRLTRFPIVLLVLLAAAVVLGGGCGGIGNPIVPDASFVGTYNGTYFITMGDDFGENGTFSFNISAEGVIQGNLSSFFISRSATLSGTMSSSDTFVLDSISQTDGTSGQGSGAITKNGNSRIASGTFTLSDGNQGTFSVNK